MGHLENVCGRFGRLLGASWTIWGRLGRMEAPPERLETVLERLEAVLDASWMPLGPSWRPGAEVPVFWCQDDSS